LSDPAAVTQMSDWPTLFPNIRWNLYSH